MKKKVAQHVGNIGKKKKNIVTNAQKPWFADEVLQRYHEAVARNGNNLCRPVDLDELRDTLANMKNGKKTGPDGCPVELLKNLPDPTLRRFVDMINYWFDNCEIPEEWHDATYFMIHKGGASSDPEIPKYIALLNTSYKVVMSILNRRLQTFLEKHSLLSNAQGGFRKGRSTKDKLMLLHETLREAREVWVRESCGLPRSEEGIR